MTKPTLLRPLKSKPSVDKTESTEDFAKLRGHANRQIRELATQLETANTQLVKLQTQIKRLSLTDELTKVANRKAFESELAKSFLRRRRTRENFSLAIIEVDDFKSYISASGRHRSEVALKKVSAALRKVVRRQTDMLARIGAFEFAVLMSATDGANAILFAEKLCNAVWSLFLTHEKSQHGTITVSVGVADTRHAPDRDGLLTNAHNALKVARKSGRNTVKHSHRE